MLRPWSPRPLSYVNVALAAFLSAILCMQCRSLTSVGIPCCSLLFVCTPPMRRHAAVLAVSIVDDDEGLVGFVAFTDTPPDIYNLQEDWPEYTSKYLPSHGIHVSVVVGPMCSAPSFLMLIVFHRSHRTLYG